jgi:hypothetical protein
MPCDIGNEHVEVMVGNEIHVFIVTVDALSLIAVNINEIMFCLPVYIFFVRFGGICGNKWVN